MQSRATHFMSLRGIANGDAVAISRKGTILKTTQDTFVLAWRNVAQKNTPLGVFLKVVLFCRVIFRRIR